HVHASGDERDAGLRRVCLFERISCRAFLPGREDPPDLGRYESNPANSHSPAPQEGILVNRSLEGIRVVALTHFAAGPIAAQYLGALGADVIKVEAPQQDVNRHALRDARGLLQGISPYFLVTNRNQRCIGLDLKRPEGRAVAKQLVETAD